MCRIAVVIGSPRENGNTRALAEAFSKGASENNSVDMISLNGLDISPCRGCNYCYTSEGHECICRDDMQSVFSRLAEADVIVMATPIYFYGASAQLKTVMDRLHTPKRKEFKVRSMVLLAVGATVLPNLFDSVLAQYDSIIRFFGLKDLGRVLVNGVKDPGDIVGRKELSDAEELGRNIR